MPIIKTYNRKLTSILAIYKPNKIFGLFTERNMRFIISKKNKYNF